MPLLTLYQPTTAPPPPPPAPAPVITSVTPSSGLTAGGESVIITGVALSGASVLFGASAAAVTTSTPNDLTVTAPAHAEGTVPVTVTTANGTFTLAAAYTYSAVPVEPPPPPPPSTPPSVLGQVALVFSSFAHVALEAAVSTTVGQIETFSAIFRLQGKLFDPPNVTLTITKPDGTELAYSSGFIHNSLGHYSYDVAIDTSGSWTIRWTGSGTFTDPSGNDRAYAAAGKRTLRATS